MDDLSSIFSSSGVAGGADAAGILAQVFGQVVQGQGYQSHAEMQAVAQRYNALQLRQQANEVQGSAQRQAIDVQRMSDLVTSRALAVAAASGGGAKDPTVVNLIARNQGEAAYRQAVALYGGQAAARMKTMQAGAAEYSAAEEAQQGRRAGITADIAATTTAMRGYASMYQKYGRGGPVNTSGGDIGGGGSNMMTGLPYFPA